MADGLRCYVVRGKRKTDEGFDYASREKVAQAIALAMKMHGTGTYSEVLAFRVRSGNVEYDASDEKET